jgi:hypothetical protein
MVGENPIEPFQNIQFLRGFRPRPVIKTAARSLKEDWQFCWPFSRSPMGKTPAGRSWKPGILPTMSTRQHFVFPEKSIPAVGLSSAVSV